MYNELGKVSEKRRVKNKEWKTKSEEFKRASIVGAHLRDAPLASGLKAQLHLAQGSTLGSTNPSTPFAPWQGSYIKCLAFEFGQQVETQYIYEAAPSGRRGYGVLSLYPGCCINDAKFGCIRHSSSKLDSALICTNIVPGLGVAGPSARQLPTLTCDFSLATVALDASAPPFTLALNSSLFVLHSSLILLFT